MHILHIRHCKQPFHRVSVDVASTNVIDRNMLTLTPFIVLTWLTQIIIFRNWLLWSIYDSIIIITNLCFLLHYRFTSFLTLFCKLNTFTIINVCMCNVWTKCWVVLFIVSVTALFGTLGWCKQTATHHLYIYLASVRYAQK